MKDVLLCVILELGGKTPTHNVWHNIDRKTQSDSQNVTIWKEKSYLIDEYDHIYYLVFLPLLVINCTKHLLLTPSGKGCMNYYYKVHL